MVNKKNLKQSGFTIVELMIATLVFSVILIVLTYGVMRISNIFFRGVTQSRTQDAARSIVDTIAQDIQTSGGAIVPTVMSNGQTQAFCVNDHMYSYILGYQINSTRHGLVASSVSGCSSANQTQDINSATINGRELLGSGMRVAKLSVNEVDTVNNIYQVNIRVVYGDDDLLCSPSNNDCSNTANNFTTYSGNSVPIDLSCKLQVGSQFCAVSELTATVQQRVPS